MVYKQLKRWFPIVLAAVILLGNIDCSLLLRPIAPCDETDDPRFQGCFYYSDGATVVTLTINENCNLLDGDAEGSDLQTRLELEEHPDGGWPFTGEITSVGEANLDFQTAEEEPIRVMATIIFTGEVENLVLQRREIPDETITLLRRVCP